MITPRSALSCGFALSSAPPAEDCSALFTPQTMTLEQALTRATDQLSAHPDLRPTALSDAVVLLTHRLGISRATLIAHPERTLDREEQTAYQNLIERRLRFEPIQYIVGYTDFYGLTLRVTPAVLIPRPETELLVEAVIHRLSRQGRLRIADVGTGSGAIAIALAHELHASVTALDLSPEALTVARENAQTLHLDELIRFLESDLLATVAKEEPFDAIISNPPYVPASDAATLHPQVRDHEPAQALFAGATGMDIYERLIPQAFDLLKSGGLLALEIGHGQSEAIRRLLEGWGQVETLPDLQQIPRVVLARRP
jgi:release factor glutamine methyltransferase